MNTATLQNPHIVQGIKRDRIAYHYNKAAVASLTLVGIFLLYLFMPYTSALNRLFHFNYSLLFIVLVPLVAFALAIFSIKHASRIQRKEKGTSLGYIALGVTTLYFMTALAIPVVLIGCYLLYTYVL
jgi:hypothetical protein